MLKSQVSVILSLYNEPIAYISKAIQSITIQTYSNLQIIIIIDNPENNEVIEYVKGIANSDERVVFFINEKNMGLVYSLNRALSHAQGEYIARMDADDIADSARIEKQLNYLCENNLDLVGSLVTDIDENDREIHGVTQYPENNEEIAEYLRYASPLAHPTWFGKKLVFDTLNGYQSIDACEDYDFLCRAVLSGFKLGVIQQSLLQYRINTNGISSTKRSIQKTALYFIRQQFRKGKSTNSTELMSFISSAKGKKKKNELERYAILSTNLKNKSGFSYYLYGTIIFITSVEARDVLFTIRNCKRIIRKRRNINE